MSPIRSKHTRLGAVDGSPASQGRDRACASCDDMRAEVARLRAMLVAARFSLSALMTALENAYPPRRGGG